jgi:hypothetical protein
VYGGGKPRGGGKHRMGNIVAGHLGEGGVMSMSMGHTCMGAYEYWHMTTGGDGHMDKWNWVDL